MDAEQFYQHIWIADNRNFGEKVSEPIAANLFGLTRSVSQSYDRTGNSERNEIKGARMVVPPRKTQTPHLNQTILERAIGFEGYKLRHFEGNIQHLKLNCFDRLYYLAFFKDCIILCSMTSDDILSNAASIGYSGTQTRGTIKNCDGQFMLRPSNLGFHLGRFYRHIVTYDDARRIMYP